MKSDQDFDQQCFYWIKFQEVLLLRGFVHNSFDKYLVLRDYLSVILPNKLGFIFSCQKRISKNFMKYFLSIFNFPRFYFTQINFNSKQNQTIFLIESSINQNDFVLKLEGLTPHFLLLFLFLYSPFINNYFSGSSVYF